MYARESKQVAAASTLPPNLPPIEYAVLINDYISIVEAYFKNDDQNLEDALCLAVGLDFEGAAQVCLALGAHVNTAARRAENAGQPDIAKKIRGLILLDSSLFLITAYYLISNFDDTLSLRYKRKVYDFLRSKISEAGILLELAAFYKHHAIVRIIINAGGKFRRNTMKRNAAYWAARNNDEEMFQLCCQNDQDLFYTLWQLENDGFTELFNKYIKNKKEDYLRAKADIQTHFNRVTFEEKPARSLELGMMFLYKGDYENFRRNVFSVKDELLILRYYDNPVAFYIFRNQSSEISKAISETTIQKLVERDQRQPYYRYLLHFLYECSDFKLARDNPKILEYLKNTTGILYQLFLNKQFVDTQKLSDEDLKFYTKIPKRDVDVFNCLIHVLSLFHPDEKLYEDLLIDQDNKNLKARLEKVNLTSNQKQYLDRFFAELSLGVRCSSLNQQANPNSVIKLQLPSDVLTNAFSFLIEQKEPDELTPNSFSRIIVQLNKEFARSVLTNRSLARLKFDNDDARNEAVALLEKKSSEEISVLDAEIKSQADILLKLSEAQEALAEEIASQDYCSGRKGYFGAKIGYFFLSLALLVGAYGLEENFDKYMNAAGGVFDNFLLDGLLQALLFCGSIFVVLGGGALLINLIFCGENLPSAFPGAERFENVPIADFPDMSQEARNLGLATDQSVAAFRKELSKRHDEIKQQEAHTKRRRTILNALFPPANEASRVQEQKAPEHIVIHVRDIDDENDEDYNENRSLLHEGDAPKRSLNRRSEF